MTDQPTPKRDRSDEIIGAITHLTEQFGFPPTTREIADHLDMWNSAVGRALQRLRDEGRVSWVEGRARTLVVNDRSSEA